MLLRLTFTKWLQCQLTNTKPLLYTTTSKTSITTEKLAPTRTKIIQSIVGQFHNQPNTSNNTEKNAPQTITAILREKNALQGTYFEERQRHENVLNQFFRPLHLQGVQLLSIINDTHVPKYISRLSRLTSPFSKCSSACTTKNTVLVSKTTRLYDCTQ